MFGKRVVIGRGEHVGRLVYWKNINM